MMKSKCLLLLLSIGMALPIWAFEVKYTKPVKAWITITDTDKEYVISGLFARETRFTAAVNRERERKYIRLLAENSLMRFLKQMKKEAVTFSGAQITSNLTSAGPDEKISFKYVILKSNCKTFSAPKEPAVTAESSTETGKSATAAQENTPSKSAEQDTEQVASTAPAETSEESRSDLSDSEPMIFEIATAQEIFDASWRIAREKELQSQSRFNRLIGDFEKRK